MSDAVLQKLQSLSPLGEAAIDLLTQMTRNAEPLPARRELMVEGENLVNPLSLVSGWAVAIRYVGDGRRQIVAVYLPGDTICLFRSLRPRGMSAIVACSDAMVADASLLRNAIQGGLSPDLDLACQRSEVLERICMFDHIMRLGRLTALERTGHFFLELRARLGLLNPLERESFDMPLTQEMLGDTLGLSVVHMNRTLQFLRRTKTLELGQGSVTISNIDALQRLARYDDCIRRSQNFQSLDAFSPAPAASSVQGADRPG